MGLLSPKILSILLVSVGLAGCFGDDDDKDDDNTLDPGPIDDGDDNNTTTPEPNLPPVANFSVTLENGTTQAAPYYARADNNLTITFNASASSDPDGNITNYVWKVTKESKIYEGQGAEFRIFIEEAQSTDFGLYEVLLRVVDDDFNITEKRSFFPLSYEAVFDVYGSTRIIGPGTAARNDANEAPASEPQNNVARGTYSTHSATITANATQLTLHAEFAPTVTAKMKLYVFKPGDDHATAAPLAESESKSSPIDLTVEDLSAIGRYTFRLDIDGEAVNQYILTAKVTYEAPAMADDTDEDDVEA